MDGSIAVVKRALVTQTPHESLLPVIRDEEKPLADDMAEKAYERTLAVMTKDGKNKPNAQHREALRFIAQALVYNGFTCHPSRLILPLFAGGGKTLSLLSVMRQTYEDRPDHGMLVAVGTIEQ